MTDVPLCVYIVKKTVAAWKCSSSKTTGATFPSSCVFVSLHLHHTLERVLMKSEMISCSKVQYCNHWSDSGQKTSGSDFMVELTILPLSTSPLSLLWIAFLQTHSLSLGDNIVINTNTSLQHYRSASLCVLQKIFRKSSSASFYPIVFSEEVILLAY